MNKLALVVLLASVCLVSAYNEDNDVAIDDVELESQAAPPTDAEETAGLQGETLVFSDFCLHTRDHVVGDIKTTTNTAASNLFNILFNSAQELGSEAMEAQRRATGVLGNQILNPDAPIQDASGDEVDTVIANGQRNIQENQRQPRSFIQAFISVIQATGTAIARGVANRIKILENINGLETAAAAVGGACDRFTEYQYEFEREFAATKKQLAEHNPSLEKLTLGQINCLTTKRVLRLEAICKLAKVAKGPLMNLLSASRQ